MKQICVFISLIILPAVITSCGSTLPTRYYRIDTDSDIKKADRVIPLRVDVNPVRTPVRYRDRIVFRKDEYEYGFYEYSRWIDPPEEMIRRSLINALSDAAFFSQVDPFGDDSDSDLDLNSEILSFDQVVDGEVNFADFGLILEFVRSDTGAPVWSYRTEERTEQRGEETFAGAMSETVKKVLSRAIEEMKKSEKLKELPGLLKQENKNKKASNQ